MNITLTWDLFVIVFFAIVITYSFIIGKHESVKIVAATYIAIVAVQALGNILDLFSGQSQPVLSLVGITLDITLLSSTKLVLFVATIILLAVKGGFEIQYSKESTGPITMLTTGAFGFATAGLLLSTLLTYISGAALLGGNAAEVASLSPVIQQSNLLKVMIVYQDVWFALPAALLIGVGFMSNE